MTNKIAAAGVLIWAIIFLFWGIRLFRGKDVQLLSKESLGKETEAKVRKLGRQLGIGIFCTALLCGVLGLNLLYDIGESVFTVVIIAVMVIIPIVIVLALKSWLKNE